MAIGLISIIIIFIGLLFYIYYQAKLIEVKPSAPEDETPSEIPKVTTPRVLHNLVGTIKEFEENTIIFEAIISQVDEKNQLISKKEMRKAAIDPTTEITYLTFTIHEETGKKIPKELKITFEDLKIGDYIEVLSNENISEKERFEASKIRILSSQE